FPYTTLFRSNHVTPQVSATSCGKTVPDVPRIAAVTDVSRSVGLGLTCTVTAPPSSATCVSDAAGCTSAEVPQHKNTSHCLAASRAASQVNSGNASPNQTTPGRIFAPQTSQRGGSIRAPPGGSFGALIGKTQDRRHASQ